MVTEIHAGHSSSGGYVGAMQGRIINRQQSVSQPAKNGIRIKTVVRAVGKWSPSQRAWNFPRQKCKAEARAGTERVYNTS